MTTSSHELRPPGSDAPLVEYLHNMWALRHFVVRMARSRVESTNVETSLGKLWLVGEPLLFIGVYGTIFGVILEATRGIDNFIGFLAVGQILYRHNSQGIQQAAVSMATFEPQLQTMAVPRALMPVTAVLTSFFTQVPSFAVMLALLLATGEVPDLKWLLLIPLIAGQVTLNMGLGMVLARAVAHVRDLAHVLTHVFRALLYASGVVFPIRAFLEPREHGELFLTILTILNPLYAYLEIARWLLQDIDPQALELSLISAALWSVSSVVIGLLWLKRIELRYGYGQIRNAP